MMSDIPTYWLTHVLIPLSDWHWGALAESTMQMVHTATDTRKVNFILEKQGTPMTPRGHGRINNDVMMNKYAMNSTLSGGFFNI